ncbi:hypothetical protein RJT34_19977 [Clitoria ternatea]|uniref:Uncharacterized protein n=1 Tax=Clitoria ternatea TaxID=43366 RepID=A0AAN9P4F1_CLITE
MDIHGSWMDIHESFTIDEGALSSKRKKGPRNLNAKTSKKEKSIIIGHDDSEVEEIIQSGEGGKVHLIKEDEDGLNDNQVDLGDEE